MIYKVLIISIRSNDWYSKLASTTDQGVIVRNKCSNSLTSAVIITTFITVFLLSIGAPTGSNSNICPNDAIISAKGDGTCDIDQKSGLPYWWASLLIRMPEVYKSFSYTGKNPKTGEGWIIGLVSSGIYKNTPDISDKFWVNKKEIPNGSDDDDNTVIDDINGANFGKTNGNLWQFFGDISATKNEYEANSWAEIIGGSINNRSGLAGISPSAKFIVTKGSIDLTYQPYVTYNPQAEISGIRYSVENNAKIIITSDFMTWNNQSEVTRYNNAYNAQLEYAASKKSFVLSSPGHFFLKDKPYAIIVGSVNGGDIINGSASKDGLYAPSMGIYSMYPSGFGKADAGTNKAYYGPTTKNSDGVAYAAGVIALMLEKNPTLERNQIVSILYSSGASVKNASGQITGKRIDAFAAINATPIDPSSAPPTPTPTAKPTPIPTPNNCKYSQNQKYARDVNRDCMLTPLDALNVINTLNAKDCPTSLDVDVNGDGIVTPLDALLVINDLNNGGSRQVCLK